MNKKNWLLPAILAVLAIVYVVWFADWFQPNTVTIFHSVRNVRTHRQTVGATPSLIFGLDRRLKLTEIRVVPLADWQTNQDVLPLWHLISTSNSVPVKAFSYGQFIRGMKPVVAGVHPQPLEPQVVYRLFVTAGKISGQHDFHLEGEPDVTK